MAEFPQDILLSVLGQLAREGTVIADAGAPELIQEFATSEWPDIERRLDSGRVKNSGAYVYTAFRAFAQRRAGERKRLEEHFRSITPRMLNQFGVQDASLLDLEQREETAELAAALASVPDVLDRAAAVAYLSGELAERELAERLGRTRYKLREILVHVWARLEDHMWRKGFVEEADHEVAVATWGRGFSVRGAAALLRKRPEAIEEARFRILRLFARNVLRMRDDAGRAATGGAGGEATSSIQLESESDMVTESRPNSVGEAQGTVVGVPVGSVSAGSAAGGKIGDVNAFWREVLFTRVKDARALNEVRAHRAQIFQELRNVVFSDEESAKLRQKPFSDWVCEVMTALGADAPPDEQEQAIIDKLNASREAEERQVGIAFAHIAEVLPPALLNWTEVFRVKPSSSAKEREYFGSDASAEQARELLPEVIDRLIAYHLTPRLIFLAARGIAMLIHRLVDRDMLAIVPDVFLVANQNVPDQTTRARTLPYAMAVSEIEAMTRCSQSTAQDLYVWLIRVSPYVTQLFPGFGVTEKFADVAKAPTLDRVALGAAPSEDMPILEQWKPRANLAKQPATAPAAAGASAKNAPARPAVAREKHQI